MFWFFADMRFFIVHGNKNIQKLSNFPEFQKFLKVFFFHMLKIERRLKQPDQIRATNKSGRNFADLKLVENWRIGIYFFIRSIISDGGMYLKHIYFLVFLA
jgi:hypothetical protein